MKILSIIMLMMLLLFVPVLGFGKCAEIKDWKEGNLPDKYNTILKSGKDISQNIKHSFRLHTTFPNEGFGEYVYYKIFVLNLYEGSPFGEDLVIVTEDVDFPNGKYKIRELRWWDGEQRMYWSDHVCFLSIYLKLPGVILTSNSLW